MRRSALFSVLLLLLPELAAAELRVRSGPEGEVASDLELDLAHMPEFTWAMDPFLKVPGLPRPVDNGPDQYKLEAVTFQGENPVAVVNGQVVRIGDRIGGRMVLRIGKDFVLLEAQGSIVEASLYDGDRAPASAADVSRASGDSAPAAGGDGTIKIEEVRK